MKPIVYKIAMERMQILIDNAISHARIYVEKDGFLEDIIRMEVQEHTIIGQPGLRLVLKTQKEKKLHIDDKLIKPY